MQCNVNVNVNVNANVNVLVCNCGMYLHICHVTPNGPTKIPLTALHKYLSSSPPSSNILASHHYFNKNGYFALFPDSAHYPFIIPANNNILKSYMNPINNEITSLKNK